MSPKKKKVMTSTTRPPQDRSYTNVEVSQVLTSSSRLVASHLLANEITANALHVLDPETDLYVPVLPATGVGVPGALTQWASAATLESAGTATHPLFLVGGDEGQLALGTSSAVPGAASVSLHAGAALEGVANAVAVGAVTSVAAGGIGIGVSAAAGTNGVAVGNGAVASGTGSTAAGTGAQATATQATALGYGTAATGDNTTAVGDSAAASGVHATAVGQVSAAVAGGSALGHSARALGIASTAVGESSTANGAGSVCLGSNTTASGSAPSTVLGYNGSDNGLGNCIILNASSNALVATASHTLVLGGLNVAAPSAHTATLATLPAGFGGDASNATWLPVQIGSTTYYLPLWTP